MCEYSLARDTLSLARGGAKSFWSLEPRSLLRRGKGGGTEEDDPELVVSIVTALAIGTEPSTSSCDSVELRFEGDWDWPDLSAPQKFPKLPILEPILGILLRLRGGSGGAFSFIGETRSCPRPGDVPLRDG